MNQITWWFALALVVHLYIAGCWDLLCMFSGGDNDTLSVAIRSTWLRYPMGVLIVAFVFLHFWYRK